MKHLGEISEPEDFFEGPLILGLLLRFSLLLLQVHFPLATHGGGRDEGIALSSLGQSDRSKAESMAARNTSCVTPSLGLNSCILKSLFNSTRREVRGSLPSMQGSSPTSQT